MKELSSHERVVALEIRGRLTPAAVVKGALVMKGLYERIYCNQYHLPEGSQIGLRCVLPLSGGEVDLRKMPRVYLVAPGDHGRKMAEDFEETFVRLTTNLPEDK